MGVRVVVAVGMERMETGMAERFKPSGVQANCISSEPRQFSGTRRIMFPSMSSEMTSTQSVGSSQDPRSNKTPHGDQDSKPRKITKAKISSAKTAVDSEMYHTIAP